MVLHLDDPAQHRPSIVFLARIAGDAVSCELSVNRAREVSALRVLPGQKSELRNAARAHASEAASFVNALLAEGMSWGTLASIASRSRGVTASLIADAEEARLAAGRAIENSQDDGA